MNANPPNKRATFVDIRWMMRKDLYAVLDIEFDSFTDPYTEDEFLAFLRQMKTIALVATLDDVIVGFVLYDLTHPKRIDILDLAVHHDYRRHKIATQLVDKLVRKLCPMRRTSITVDVRETNLAGQLFFRENDFRCVETLHGLYGDSDEEALRFCFAVDVD